MSDSKPTGPTPGLAKRISDRAHDTAHHQVRVNRHRSGPGHANVNVEIDIHHTIGGEPAAFELLKKAFTDAAQRIGYPGTLIESEPDYSESEQPPVRDLMLREIPAGEAE